MIHQEIIHKALKTKNSEIIKKILGEPIFENFYLGGSRALYYQIGEGLKNGIELYSLMPFNTGEITVWLTNNLKVYQIKFGVNHIVANLEHTTVTISHSAHCLIEDIRLINGIRMASISDIAAMTLFRLINNESKLLYCDFNILMSMYNKTKMLEFYAKRYPYKCCLEAGQFIDQFVNS